MVSGLPADAETTRPALTGTLAYSRLTEGTWQVWQKNLVTDERLQVTSSPGDKRYPAWRPDGRISYHTTNYAAFLAQAATSDPQPLLNVLWPVRDLAWSPDGRRVAFARFRTDLVDSANVWVAGADGSAPRLMTQEAGIQYTPAWSPDGAQIAYIGGQGFGTYELYVMRADGSNRRQLTHNRSHEFLPAWSPDGRQLAFSADASGDYEIWIIHADGSGLRQLTVSPGLDTRPAWSPDGKRLAFTTNRAGALAIWVMQADGSRPSPLEHADGGACDPAWR